MKRFFSLCLAAVLAAGLCACGGGQGQAPAPDAQGVDVVFVPKLTGNAFFEAANQGAQAFAEQQGFTVTYRGSATASVEEQLRIVQQCIDEKADAICISALDSTALDGTLKQAMEAGIPVVTWDSDVSGDARMLMVSQGTPDQLGTMLVEMGAKSLPAAGKNPTKDTINYVWHYSQASVTDQNSWQQAGEAYIKATYPNWVNVQPGNYYSNQDPALAVQVGEEIFAQHPEVDLIICNDSTSLPGQAQAAQNLGFSAEDVAITGFASPNAMKAYCTDGVLERWGLWDCQTQGALGCYLAFQLATGKALAVGEKIDVPDIGIVTVMPNTVLDPGAYTSASSGVVLLPSRAEFTAANMDDYDF